MSSTSIIAEALARVEHKLDLLLESQAGLDKQMVLHPVGSAEHLCPICQQQPQYVVDVMSKTLKRTCGCATGLQSPIDFQTFAPPTTSETGNGPEE